MEKEGEKDFSVSYVLLKIQKLHAYVLTYDSMCVYVQFITLSICNNGYD
jgi:hypothetical protein